MGNFVGRPGLWTLRACLLFAMLLGTAGAGAPGSELEAPVLSRQALANGSGGTSIQIGGASQSDSDYLLIVLSRSSQGGWEQRFEKLYGQLDLRIGSRDGPLISWPDRGSGGRHTWSSTDRPETRSITRWVGNAYEIHLWARLYPEPKSNKALCYMDTIYNGNLRQRWEFAGDSDHPIKR